MADSAAGTTPCRTPSRPGVHGGDDPGLVVGQQDRHAVGHEHAEHQPGRGGDQGVGGGHRAVLRAVDDRDAGAVHLVHPDQPVLGHAELAGHPGPVGGDVGRVVADVVAEVERVVRENGTGRPAGR